MDKRYVFLVNAAFYLILMICSICLKEKKFEEKKERLNIYEISLEKYNDLDIPKQRPMKLFWLFIKRIEIIKLFTVIFLISISPSFSDPFFYYYTEKLKFSSESIAEILLVNSIAGIIVMFIYNKYSSNISFKKAIFFMCLGYILFDSFYLILLFRLNIKMGISDYWFCMIVDTLYSSLGYIYSIPYLILGCYVCPKDIEGTVYSFILAISDFGGFFSYLFGSLLTTYFGIDNKSFDNLFLILLVGMFYNIIILPSLYLIDEKSFVKNDGEELIDIIND